jgi:hypothetical protein
MDAVLFTLIGTSKEKLVTERAVYQPFGLRALTHSYNQGQLCQPTVRSEEER